MAKCDICDKSPQFGHNVSHSHHKTKRQCKTKRQWKPNIQKVTITEGNVTKRLNVCAKCLKTMNRTR
jgi:large subunit ribosomal protein L28